MADWYGPIQRGVAGISGVLERGQERESRHLTRMGELGLAGRRLGMQEEEFGLTRRLKGLQIGKLEREEGKRKAEEARLLEPSNLKDISRLSEFAGPAPFGQGNEYWVQHFSAIIPKKQHEFHKEGPLKGQLKGFDVTKKDVSRIMNQVRARLGPEELVGTRQMTDQHISWLIEHGATKEGTDKRSAQLRAQLRQQEQNNIKLKAAMEGPVAYLASIYVLQGPDAIKDPEHRKLAKDYLDATAAKKGPAFATTRPGLEFKRKTALEKARITAGKPTGQLTEFQKTEAPKKIDDYLYGITHDEDGKYVEPTDELLERVREYARGYGYNIVEGKERIIDVSWGRDTKERTFDIVPISRGGGGLTVTRGPPVPTREEAMEELRRRGISF